MSGADHVLAMVAVGLWGAQLGAPAIWVLPVAFPLVMAMGGMLGLLGVPIPGVEYGIAASAIVLGAAVAFEVRPALVVAALVVGCFAIFHGHAHGTELPPGQSALLYSMGFVIATGCLHAVGIGIGTVHRRTWGRHFCVARARWSQQEASSSSGRQSHEACGAVADARVAPSSCSPLHWGADLPKRTSMQPAWARCTTA